LAIDNGWKVDNNRRVPASIIVLNGASSSGKTTIARALQDLWPRPLILTGIDAFILGWPDSYATYPADDGSPAAPSAGVRIVPGLGPAPSWIPEFGDDFHTMMRLAHESWALISQGGVNLVIDHVLIDPTLRKQARDTLVGAFWVGVMCDVDELIRRETARGDRHVGFASGTSAVVHREMSYDLVIDTTATSTELLARQVYDALRAS
jgi:chloramphenicol 3-O phosphotransferase